MIPFPDHIYPADFIIIIFVAKIVSGEQLYFLAVIYLAKITLLYYSAQRLNSAFQFFNYSAIS